MDAIQTGYKIGMLTVEGPTKQRKGGYMVWKCRCGCGKEVFLDTRCLKRGAVRDCGCKSPPGPERSLREAIRETDRHPPHGRAQLPGQRPVAVPL